MEAKRRRNERGFGLLEVLIALALTATIATIGLRVAAQAGHGFAREAMMAQSQTTIDRLSDQLLASAHTAAAVFVPSSCGGSDAAGDGANCSSIRFYNVDANGTTHLWGWEFSGSTLKECLAYPSADGACTTYGASSSLTKFVATPTTISNLPIVATLGYVPTSKEQEVAPNAIDPNGRIVAGNRVAVLQIGDANVQREVHLLQGGAPFSTAVLSGTFVPPSIGSLSGSDGSTMYFPAPAAEGAPAQNAAFTETNYNQYAGYVGGTWNYAPNANPSCIGIGAPSAGGGTQPDITLPIVPESAGTCSFTVATFDQSFVTTAIVYQPPTYTTEITNVSSGTITVGSNATFTTTAPLNSPAAPGYDPFIAAPATSVTSSIVSTSGPCTASEAGSTVTVATSQALGIGTCTVTVNGNDSAVPYAIPTTATSVSFNVAWPPLVAGVPSCIATSSTAATCNSSAPSSGSGAGYGVSYSIGGCGYVAYSCSISGLSPSTPYTVTATYTDSAGQYATGSTSFTTQAAPTCPTGDTGTPPNCVAPAPSPSPTPPCPGGETLNANNVCQVPWAEIVAECDGMKSSAPRADVWQYYVVSMGGIIDGLNNSYPGVGTYASTSVTGDGILANTDYEAYFTNGSHNQFYFYNSNGAAYIFDQTTYTMGIEGTGGSGGLTPNSGVEICVVKSGYGWDAGD